MTYSLTGMSDLGVIDTEGGGKDAQLFQMPIPRQDASEVIALDLFGTSEVFTISGHYVGTPSTFLTQLRGLITGKQISRTYASDAIGESVQVMVQRINWNYVGGTATRVTYTIELLRCKAVV